MQLAIRPLLFYSEVLRKIIKDLSHIDAIWTYSVQDFAMCCPELKIQNIAETTALTVTQKLLDRWSENVGVNIVQQIQDYAREIENWQNSDSPTPYQFRKK